MVISDTSPLMGAPGSSNLMRSYSPNDESDVSMQKTHLPPLQPLFSPEEEKILYRKIDIRLIPILALMYLFSGVDRGAHILSKLHFV